MSFIIPIQFKGYFRRVDKSVGLKLESEMEVRSEEIGKIDSLIGNLGVLAVSESAEFNLPDGDIKKMLEEMPRYDATEIKSPSKRYRAILYRVLEKKLGKKPTEVEFGEYYIKHYEELCQKGIEYLNSDL